MQIFTVGRSINQHIKFLGSILGTAIIWSSDRAILCFTMGDSATKDYRVEMTLEDAIRLRDNLDRFINKSIPTLTVVSHSFNSGKPNA